MPIKSIDKAVTILNCYSPDRQVLGVGEISQMTGYTKSTTSRILATLEKRGCVEKAEGFGKYRLGYRIYLWGNIVRKQISLAAIARPVMEKLRDACGEEVILYVIEGDRRVSLEIAESIHRIANIDRVGRHYPLHAGAAGKILFAYFPKEKRSEFYARGPLEKFTIKTITDVELLEKELEIIRKQGYAVSRGEREPDAFSVNAPVMDASRQVVAGLSVSGPVFRLNDEKLKIYIQLVIAAAKEISEMLGYIRDT